MNKLIKTTAAVLGGLVLTAAMGISAFAAQANALPTTASQVQFTKTINTTAAPGAGNPTGTISFTVSPYTGELGAEDGAKAGTAAQLGGGSVQAVFAAGTDGSINTSALVSIPFTMTGFEAPGLYYYTVTENDPLIAGLTPSDESYILKVQVVNKDADNPDGESFVIQGAVLVNEDDDKVDGIENIYTTHTLTLTKELKGNFANDKQEFSFTISLQDPDESAHMSSVTVTAGGASDELPMENGKQQFTRSIRAGESIQISGLPDGVKYTITENGAEDYNTTWSNDAENTTKTSADNIMPDADVSVTVTNTKNTTPPTGLTNRTAAYAGLLALAAAGAVVLRRRKD